MAAKAIEVGMTTNEIDRIVHEATVERECYPKLRCTSVNEVICHGILDTRVIKDGDICNGEWDIMRQLNPWRWG